MQQKYYDKFVISRIWTSGNAEISDSGNDKLMDYLAKQRRARSGSLTPDAIHRRLVAVRLATGFKATDLAESASIKYTTFKSQEGSGSPSLRMLDFYWKAFQVDPNFILGGDFSRILPDTLEAILSHLDDPEAGTSDRAT
ncbi:hypothetical protein [Histidinibacterium aquaticum]|uniref:Uncharacterized protein n=1 Tax=Histidinibacterium aquaticum TaxID=2613962 RepID=A0A5J5GRQ7_9RHOB|nr:hypothetical protein [Histidinibacterium aquaticum]KAA9010353.1 hypothetical protein F3S47_03665 [Histidinibacterium aquaticum]